MTAACFPPVLDRAEHALQLRVSLIEYIAGTQPRCACCRKPAEPEELEVDHRDGRTWYGRSRNFLDRIRKQWRELDAGVAFRALCKSCNSSDGTRRFRGRPRWR